MNTIFALYTGCTPRIAEPELLKSTRAVASYLGIDLLERREFSCCGGSHTQDIDDFSSLLLNARNLAYVDSEGLDLVTICNTCQFMLARTRKRLLDDEYLRKKINTRLKKYNLEFTGRTKVRHFLYVLIESFGYGGLAERVVNSLDGLSVASFYGCHNIRPASLQAEENLRESPWNPRSMDRLVQALGGRPVYYETANSCCGFHVSLHAAKTARKLTGEILRQAYEAGADAIITPCPLCHTNLDGMQAEALYTAEKGPRLPILTAFPNAFNIRLPVVDAPVSLPALHFEQLIGIAFGIGRKKLGLKNHVVPLKRNDRLQRLVERCPK